MDNSKEFFDELYNSEFTQIEKYVRRMLYDSNAVEDIVQETFFEVYRKREELMKHPNIKGWLRVTAKNKVMKWEEKQRKYSLDFDFLIDNSVSDLNPKVDDFKMVEVYTAVKEILSEEELELLRCYYEYGYTSQEIAQKLGVTETCFKVRILRMKQKIRNSMLLPFLFGVCGVLYQLIIFIWQGCRMEKNLTCQILSKITMKKHCKPLRLQCFHQSE